MCLALMLVGAVMVAGCGTEPDRAAGEVISKKLDEFARARRSLRVGHLTAARFDRLVVISGLAHADAYEHLLGFRWSRADELGYRCCEPASVWAFVRDRRVIAYFRPSFDAGYGEGVPAGSYRPATRIGWHVPDPMTQPAVEAVVVRAGRH